MKAQNQGLIVCGTDTDVGKTIVSALLVQGLNAIYWKPIQSGLEDEGDTGHINQILKLSTDRCLTEAYKFKAPVSPHWAAEQENITIEAKKLKLPIVNRLLIIETAGGLMVPLSRNFMQIDQIKKWQLPIVLVARTGLGTLNHTFLSLEALKKRNIPILGIFLNGPKHSDNPKTIEQLGEVPIIGHLPPLKEITKEALSEEWENQKMHLKFDGIIGERA